MINFVQSLERVDKITLAFFLMIALAVAYTVSSRSGATEVYLRAARGVTAKQNIYAPPLVVYGKDQYYYSPLFALALTPFTAYVVATKFFWGLFSMLLLVRIRSILLNGLEATSLTTIQQYVWLALMLLLSLNFLMLDLINGEVTVFFLWMILESLQLIKNGKPIPAGLILAVGINVKILPVMILPYLAFRAHFRALGVCIAGFIALLFLPAFFIGWNYNQHLLMEWWKVINPANKQHIFESPKETLYSIPAMIPIFVTHSFGKIPFLTLVSTIVNFIRVLLIALSLFFLDSWPFKKETNSLKAFWESAYFILLIPLLMPHQQLYNFLFALPMIGYMLYFFIRTGGPGKGMKNRGLVLAGFVLCVTPYLPFFIAPLMGEKQWHLVFFQFFIEHKIITFSTLLLIPFALFCRPEKLNQSGGNSE